MFYHFYSSYAWLEIALFLCWDCPVNKSYIAKQCNLSTRDHVIQMNPNTQQHDILILLLERKHRYGIK